MNKMVNTKSVVIDCFPESAEHYRDDFSIIVVDVLRATTTATTAINLGWRVFPAQTTDDALMLMDALRLGVLAAGVDICITVLAERLPWDCEWESAPHMASMDGPSGWSSSNADPTSNPTFKAFALP